MVYMNSLQTKLLLLDSWVDSNNDQHADQNKCPKFQSEHVEVVVGLRRADDRSLKEQE